MKVLFCGRSIGHFTYYESILEELCKAEHELVLLHDQDWSKSASRGALSRFRDKFPSVTVGWSLRRRGMLRKPLFALREMRSFASYASRPEQSDFYLERWQNYLPPPLCRWGNSRKFRWLVGRAVVRRLLSAAEALIPADPRIKGHIKEIGPDVVVASPVNMRFSEEVEYVKAAKSLNIPTVISVLSWDNLTTKGLFNVKPNLLLVWNDAHRKEARAVHSLRDKSIATIGSPFFDKWFSHAGQDTERAGFLAKVGLPVEEPFVLYLGSSANIARDESWIVRELHEALQNHPGPGIPRINILVRPHPANAKIYEDLPSQGIAVWPRAGSLPDEEESMSDFANSVRYCVGALGINTSGMIDTVIHDCPTLTLMTERYQATQLRAQHFCHLFRADVLEVLHSIEEVRAAIYALTRGEGDRRATQRRNFVETFVRPNGWEVPAGLHAAHHIEDLVAAARRGRTVRSVTRSIQDGHRKIALLRDEQRHQ